MIVFIPSSSGPSNSYQSHADQTCLPATSQLVDRVPLAQNATHQPPLLRYHALPAPQTIRMPAYSVPEEPTLATWQLLSSFDRIY